MPPNLPTRLPCPLNDADRDSTDDRPRMTKPDAPSRRRRRTDIENTRPLIGPSDASQARWPRMSQWLAVRLNTRIVPSKNAINCFAAIIWQPSPIAKPVRSFR